MRARERQSSLKPISERSRRLARRSVALAIAVAALATLGGCDVETVARDLVIALFYSAERLPVPG